MSKIERIYAASKEFKPIFTIVLLIASLCVMGLLASISYANSSNPVITLNNTIEYNDNLEEAIQDNTPEQYQTVRMRVTAYCPCPKCCGKHSDGITACGHKIYGGDTFVAADKRFSFGTKMIIPGYNSSETVEVLDRGGVIRGNRLDVFFNSHEEAMKWGVRYLDVKILTQ